MSFPSMAHLFLDRVQQTPDKIAFEYRKEGKWTTMHWGEAGHQARHLACALLSLGVQKGDRCAILSNTRVEWIIIDLGILCAGAATTTIYASNRPTDCAYILQNSGATICFVENQHQLDKIIEEKDNLPELKQIVTIEPFEAESIATLQQAPHPIQLHSLQDLLALGKEWHGSHPNALSQRLATITPEDLATLIYTSGTTGPPKGVMLLHDCWVYQAESIAQSVQKYMEPDDKQYVFLPLAHSYGKVLELVGIAFGALTVIDGDIDYFLQGVQETRPSLIPAVPRVFEKAHNRIVQRAQEAGGWKYKVFQWATGIGQAVVKLQMRGESPSGWLALQYRLADRLVYRRLRAAFGGKVRAFVSGGAPLSPEIAAFFFAAGMPVLEGYGLTETAAVATTNKVDTFRLGTVGQPGDGTQLRIADDGEILIKSRSIMKGYFQMPEESAAVLQNGWFHTGDIGHLDESGFLQITGRKKDLIITAGGKNIPPQNIENQIKAASPYISQVVIHGDKRNYCVALVTFDEDNVREWANQQGIKATTYPDLARHPQVKALLWDVFQATNQRLASYETIKYIHILERELTIEDGELTPSMKVKRRVIEERYRDELDSMYNKPNPTK